MSNPVPALMRANDNKVPSASSSFDFLNADHGDLSIRTFWEGSTYTIKGACVTKLGSKSFWNLSLKKALKRQEKEKKKILQALWEINVAIVPFRAINRTFYGFEIRSFLKTLEKLLAEEYCN